MTTPDRPYHSFQMRYMQLLAAAEEFNAKEILLAAADWYVMTQCAHPSTKFMQDGNWHGVMIGGRIFRPKPSTKPPHGTLDLTGPEPCYEA
jgi:hypothetical protein